MAVWPLDEGAVSRIPRLVWLLNALEEAQQQIGVYQSGRILGFASWRIN